MNEKAPYSVLRSFIDTFRGCAHLGTVGQAGLYGCWGRCWLCDMNSASVSMGTGKMMVELFSAEMLFRVCR